MAGKGLRLAVASGLAAAAVVAGALWLDREKHRDCDDLVAALQAFAREEAIPGGVIAIRDGTGEIRQWTFGEARPGEAMTPGIRFRIASLSKPITARAIRILAERGRLSLDDKLAEVVSGLDHSDPRWGRVTIEQLLNHTGGWDSGRDLDPVFEGPRISRALGLRRPPRCADIARFMARRPLQFDPGERHEYSNFGYCLLGLAIEARGGQSYESFVRSDVLAGIEARLAGTAWAPAGDEPEYVTRDGEGNRIPVERAFADAPYFSPASHAANGGWIVTALGYLEFMAGTDRAWATGGPRAGETGEDYYGRGWRVWPSGDGAALSHWGRLPGTFSVAVLHPGGAAVVALYNGDPRRPYPSGRRLVNLARSADLSACGG